MNKKNARNHSAGERLSSTMEDAKSGYKDFEEKTLQSISDAKDDAVTWAEEGVSNIKVTIDETARSIDKNVKKGLTQYNAKAQELADKTPGGLGDNVIRYPWVAITVSLLMGIGLGFLIKPGRKA